MGIILRTKKLILFIHGLGGDSRKTWGKFPMLIEGDKDLSCSYNLDFYSFPTSLFRLPFQEKYPKIQDLANGLKSQIKNKFQEFQEIIFVCHSLGGLIGRKYILEEIKNNNTLKVSKLLLYATPNNGANLASVAKLIPLRHNQLTQLCKGSDFIEFLNEDWSGFNVKEHIKCRYVIAGLDKVVDNQSAKNFWGNQHTETVIDKNHRDVVKPDNKKDLSFIILKNFLLDSSGIDEEVYNIKEKLTNHLSTQIDKQKKIKKYIPEVFTERTDLKDRLRYFVAPSLFWNKVIEDLERLDFNRFTNFLENYKIGTFELLIPEKFKKNIETIEVPFYANELLKYIKEKINQLRDWESKFEHRSNGDFDERIPVEKRYFYEHQRVFVYPSFYKWKLDTIITHLKFLASRCVIITAPAGHGKTNLLCDFAEKVLLKRTIDCLFFTANEFNHIDLNNIGDFVLKRVFKVPKYPNWSSFLEAYRKIFETSKKPLLIIIDALNEHLDIMSFSEKLLHFTEELLEHEFIKIIYTCRSEYFDERFSNFQNSSISDEILYEKNFDRKIREDDKEKLLKAYFSFFKIHYSSMSQMVFKKLTDNPLLLRIFCEAYADVDKNRTTHIPYLIDLYKEDLFRKYIEKKEEDLNKKRDNGRVPVVQKGVIFKKTMKSLVKYMLDKNKFSDIQIEDLRFSETELDELARVIDEDILLRNDLMPNDDDRSVFARSIEVLNFTFDEFRDFLIADTLIFDLFEDNIENFKLLIDRIASPKVSTYEGTCKFLFHISKRLNRNELDNILETRNWYRSVFFSEIFSIKDEFIQEKDISRIRREFLVGGEKTGSIIMEFLYHRWNSNDYPNLNIRLLFQWFQDIDDDLYCSKLSPLFYDNGYGYSNIINWNQLMEDLSELLEDTDLNEHPEFHNLFEFLILMLGIPWRNPEKVNDLLIRYASKYFGYASEIVFKYVTCIHVSEIVDDLCMTILNFIKNGLPIPNEFFKKMFRDFQKKSIIPFTRADSYRIELLLYVSEKDSKLFTPKEMQILVQLKNILKRGENVDFS